MAGSVRRGGIRTDDERIAWFVAVATVPAAIAGAAGESFIEDQLGEPWQIAILMAVFAILLWIADRVPQRKEIGDRLERRGRVRPCPVPGTDAGRVSFGRDDHGRALPRSSIETARRACRSCC